MKPTLRSFFSIAPPCANTSVAVSSGKNCESAASAVEAPTDLQEGAARGVLREHRAHHRRGDDALVALLLALDRHALQLRAASRSCSAWLTWRPQAQPLLFSRTCGSNGLSNVDMATRPCWAGPRTGDLPSGIAIDVPKSMPNCAATYAADTAEISGLAAPIQTEAALILGKRSKLRHACQKLHHVRRGSHEC